VSNMIIGIAGPSASGKTTVAHLLEKKYSGVRMRYSAILSDLARGRGLDPEDKGTLQNLYLTERQSRGEDFLAEEMKSRVSLLHPSLLVIEGNRRLADVKMLKALAKERKEELLIIFVDAASEIRLKRYNERMEKQAAKAISAKDFTELEASDAEDEIAQLGEIAKKEGLYIHTDNLSESDTMRIIDDKVESLK